MWSGFRHTKEYKELAGKYRGKDLDMEANTLFQRMYAGEIEKEMRPYGEAYYKAVYDRYGTDIEAVQNQLIKDEVGGRVASLNDDISKSIAGIDRKMAAEDRMAAEEARKRGKEGAYSTNPYAEEYLRMEDALGGVERDPKRIREREADNRRRTLLASAKSLNDDSMRIINEAAKKGSSWYSALGRGVRDEVFNPETWNFGLSDLTKGINLKRVVEKADKGEQLSKDEQILMDACVTNLATQAYYSSDLSASYRAGQTTGASVPFMLEFAVNPVAASGSSIAKGILKYGMKKFGKAAGRRCHGCSRHDGNNGGSKGGRGNHRTADGRHQI